MSLICYSVRDLIGRDFLSHIYQVYRSVAKLINLISIRIAWDLHMFQLLSQLLLEKSLPSDCYANKINSIDVLFTYK